MNMVEGEKTAYHQWYQEQNRWFVIELWHVAYVNETQVQVQASQHVANINEAHMECW
jgi:hypothetical protein